MEDKIEVGEYVRTKKGIAKVTNIDDLDNVAWTDRKDIYFGVIRESGYLDWYIYDDGTVLKEPSFNVIDLIEVGDYVNGYKVLDKYLFNGEKPILETTGEEINCKCLLCNEDIKSIVTKEQMEAIKYVVR